MPSCIWWEKKVGQTPLQALEEIRAARPHLADVPLSYAGRLDPMASGVLLVLVGDECKNRERYLGLDKEYEFEVLLGFKSDTGDILGLSHYVGVSQSHTLESYEHAGRSVIGTHVLPYPVFSSKTVHGKPLFHYALEGTLDTITIPTSEMIVRTITFLGAYSLSCSDTIDAIEEKIMCFNPPLNTQQLGSDFRKNEIITQWNELREQTKNTTCTILKYSALVSSGTYIRVIAHCIASSLGTSGLAYTIHRTKIG